MTIDNGPYPNFCFEIMGDHSPVETITVRVKGTF